MNIESVNGIGLKTKKDLEKLNIYDINDLVNYYPYRYDFIKINSIHDTNEMYTVKAIVIEIPKVFYIKRNLNRMTFRAISEDVLLSVTIFNRAFLKTNITQNKEVLLIGKYDKYKNTFVASDIKFNTMDNSITPIYHLTYGIKNTSIHKYILNALPFAQWVDLIPNYLNNRYNFISKKDALNYIHNPSSLEEIKKARLKLIYEELFEFMFKINYLKRYNTKVLGIKRNIDNIDVFINKLPFKLTVDQLASLKDIMNDMNSPYRMNRLILGDVGSGKTIVSIMAMYVNYLSGYESVLMAPTEILANQHYNNIVNLFKDTDIRVELLTGKTSKKDKKVIYEEIRNHEVDIVIGTHALFNDEIIYNNLGLVVTDEQHRFGVNHRHKLENKGICPDVLYLSATPIPRTYALTIYGDLDISIIKSKPSGRKDIKTVLKKEKDIKDVLYKMYEELKSGHQIYVVSPLIEDNEELDLKSVIELEEKFKSAFKGVSIGVLHGKLSNDEKDSIMNDFKLGKIKILISTTVIEVGVDVGNATMMVIYNAERFGLATLHQLRGRVGRNSLESYCYLVSNYDTERLNVLVESNDGFYISEKDFELRGAGDMFGIKQSGDFNFKIANIRRDNKILMQAKKDSDEFIDSEEYLNNSYYKKIINDINFIN